MSATALLAASGIGAGAACVASFVRPPTARLAPRVRPYAIVARSALGLPPEPLRTRAAFTQLSRALESRGDASLARMLRRAGVDETPEAYRVRQLSRAMSGGAVAGAATAFLVRLPLVALVAAVAGFVHGAARARRGLERAIAQRAARMRLELYTVNHMLAIHVRTGAGVMQAVQRVIERGRGAVVDELAEIVASTRRGVGEAEAFREAAAQTPEPAAARTYQLLAAGVERGVDLAAGLLALSADLRDARREQLHQQAVRRRAAMLVPTIAVLAPIMLLFIAAPLPSIVLGRH
jgi:tight adherence protein C